MRPEYLSLLYNRPWAVLPEALQSMALSAARDHELVFTAAVPGERRRTGSVAVIPVMGMIKPRMGGGLFDLLFGGCGLDDLTAQFRQAMDDSSCRAIVLNIDSPGGSTAGVEELASEILASRGQKPVIAVANSMAASAAYWLACCADEVVASPSAEVGSIGVFALHLDESRAVDSAGITPTFVSAGRYKTEGNPLQPLSDEGRVFLQQRVNEYYDSFTAAVAKGRGVTPAAVRDGFGQGRLVGAKEAVRLGMADRIATLDQTLARLGASRAARGTTAAMSSGGIGYVAGPIPPHETPKAPEDAPWDGPAEVAQAEGEAELRRMHAWVDSDGDPEAKSSYKLPHHRADGTLVLRGVMAAGMTVQGGRGGVDIPDGDMPGVKRHLERHYHQFDRTAPWEMPERDMPMEETHKEGAADVSELDRRRRRLRILSF